MGTVLEVVTWYSTWSCRLLVQTMSDQHASSAMAKTGCLAGPMSGACAGLAAPCRTRCLMRRRGMLYVLLMMLIRYVSSAGIGGGVDLARW